MYQKYFPGLLLECVQPLNQPFHICMGTHSIHLLNVGLNLNGFTEQPHLPAAFQKASAQRSYGLIPRKDDGTFRPPQIML